MQGRTCLVTGGSSGVGKATAKGLARLGATVVIAARDPDRGNDALEEIRRESAGGSVELLCADLSLRSGVQELARSFLVRYASLHVLSLNAAVLPMRRETTAEGLEKIFATNYLGHFLLTQLLLGALKAGAPSRVLIVCGSPRTVARGSIDFEDIQMERRYSPVRATLQAAFAKALFTFELARRQQGTGITANAFHPGLVRSRLARNLPLLLRLPVEVLQLFLRNECPTSVHVASSPEVDGVTGAFFVGTHPAPFQAAAATRETASRLWDMSEELSGLK